MFETLEKTGRAEALRRFTAFLISSVGHVVGIFVFVLLPLVFFNVLPESELLTFLIVPPPPPAPPPPPIPPSEGQRKQTAAAPVKVNIDLPPDHIPRGVPPPIDEPLAVNLLGIQAFVGTGVQVGPLGTGSGVSSNLLGALAPAPPPTLPPPPKPVPHKPLPVGGIVQESKLIRRIEPVYPEIARQARVSGTVILQVTVDEEGNVTEVKVLQGHPLLNDEAVRAVRQWKYSPTLLNGEPVPVTASITVIFKLARQ